MPILRKNFETFGTESLNFTIDYVSRENDVDTVIPLNNYRPELVFSSGGRSLATYTTGDGVWTDDALGHIGVDISHTRLTAAGTGLLDYTLYLQNKFVPSDRDAILRGRIQVAA